jgi:RTX calcium-binding nonapeptide repeat (4 copies)
MKAVRIAVGLVVLALVGIVPAGAAVPFDCFGSIKHLTPQPDTFTNTANWACVYGDAGGDTITGTSGFPDQLDGEEQPDTLDGQGSGDNLHGGPGDDTLFGRYGNDFLAGQDGGDELNGGPGDDGIEGGPDSDQIFDGPGADVVDGGETPGDHDVWYHCTDGSSDSPSGFEAVEAGPEWC